MLDLLEPQLGSEHRMLGVDALGVACVVQLVPEHPPVDCPAELCVELAPQIPPAYPDEPQPPLDALRPVPTWI